MKKTPKGCYGYVAYQKKNQIIRTIISFALPLALFFGGWYTTKTKVNLLTIVAVLGLLPASKIMVNMIMFLKSNGCTDTMADIIKEQNIELKNIYDLNITTYKKEYQISNLSVRGNTICAVSEDVKTDMQPLEKYLKESLDHNGYKGYQLKVFTDTAKYLDRREALLKMESDEKEDAVLNFIMGLSL